MSVVIFGSGITNFRHLTVEALLLLRDCDVVFGLSGSCRPFLLNGVRDFRDITKYYRRFRTPETHIVKAVLSADSNGKRIGLCVVGHPLLFDSTVTLLIRKCEDREIDYKVFPGISSVDMVLCVLGYSINDDGLQIYEASIFGEVKTDPRLPILIFRLAALLECPKSRVRLFQKLSRIYPPRHTVFLVECSHDRTGSSRVGRVDLKGLESRTGSVTKETSLFIPPIRLHGQTFCSMAKFQ